MPGGRPTKYQDWMAQKAYEVMVAGKTIYDLADELGITMATLCDWMDKKSPRYKPEFSESYKRGFEEKKKNYAHHLEKAARDPSVKHPALLIFVAKTAYNLKEDQGSKDINVTVNLDKKDES